MTFKKWLMMIENMSGPGGGGTMDSAVGSVERDAKDVARRGAGAFPHFNSEENPPVGKRKSPDASYYPDTKKRMKKKMKKV